MNEDRRCLHPAMGVSIILIHGGGPKKFLRLAPEHRKKKLTPFFYGRSAHTDIQVMPNDRLMRLLPIIWHLWLHVITPDIMRHCFRRKALAENWSRCRSRCSVPPLTSIPIRLMLPSLRSVHHCPKALYWQMRLVWEKLVENGETKKFHSYRQGCEVLPISFWGSVIFWGVLWIFWRIWGFRTTKKTKQHTCGTLELECLFLLFLRIDVKKRPISQLLDF